VERPQRGRLQSPSAAQAPDPLRHSRNGAASVARCHALTLDGDAARGDPDLTPYVTGLDAIGDLEARDELAEPDEQVNGRYGDLLPAIPPGQNYLFWTEKRGHPEPLFRWRSRYWTFLLKLDPARPATTIQSQPGPYIGPFH